jgi:hypothetical protein
MPGTRVPVIRQPFQPGDLLPFWAYGRFAGDHLYRVDLDPAEDENLAAAPLAREATDLMRQALLALEAPADQLARMGLA